MFWNRYPNITSMHATLLYHLCFVFLRSRSYFWILYQRLALKDLRVFTVLWDTAIPKIMKILCHFFWKRAIFFHFFGCLSQFSTTCLLVSAKIARHFLRWRGHFLPQSFQDPHFIRFCVDVLMSLGMILVFALLPLKGSCQDLSR